MHVFCAGVRRSSLANTFRTPLYAQSYISATTIPDMTVSCHDLLSALSRTRSHRVETAQVFLRNVTEVNLTIFIIKTHIADIR
jgi:hypothetical protein